MRVAVTSNRRDGALPTRLSVEQLLKLSDCTLDMPVDLRTEHITQITFGQARQMGASS